jgi:hypothetical protein
VRLRHCTAPAAQRAAVRAAAPAGALRLFIIEFDDEDEEEERTFPALAELVAHPITRLELSSSHNAPLTPDELGVVAEAAHALRLSELHFQNCALSPAAASPLARMLSSAALTEFTVYNPDFEPPEMFDVPSAALLSSALRANRTLRCFTLWDVRLWDDVQAAVLLLGALTGHVSIRSMFFRYNDASTEAASAAIGAALGALVSANAPVLEELDVSWCSLGDAGLGPLGSTRCSATATCESCMLETMA